MGWLSMEVKKVIFFEQSDVGRTIYDPERYVQVMGWLGLVLLQLPVLLRYKHKFYYMIELVAGDSSYVANLLSGDRSQDVIDMIEASEIYEWGFGGGGDDNCDPNTQNCGSSQILAQAFASEGLFSQAYWSTLDIETQSVEVPESSPMTALLGLGLLSFGGLVKDKSTRK